MRLYAIVYDCIRSRAMRVLYLNALLCLVICDDPDGAIGAATPASTPIALRRDRGCAKKPRRFITLIYTRVHSQRHSVGASPCSPGRGPGRGRPEETGEETGGGEEKAARGGRWIGGATRAATGRSAAEIRVIRRHRRYRCVSPPLALFPRREACVARERARARSIV